MFFKSKKPDDPVAADAGAFAPPPGLRDAFQSVKDRAPSAQTAIPSRPTPPAQAAAPSPAEARAPASAARREASAQDPTRAFAQVVTLLSRSTEAKRLSLADIEWLVTAPIRANQVVVAEGRAKSGAQGAIGAVLWARVSPQVDQRLTSDKSPIARLSPEEWTSGDIPWVIATAGEEKIVKAMLDQLLKGPLAGRSIRTRALGPGGILTIQELRSQQVA